MEVLVIIWLRKRYQFSTYEGLGLFKFFVVSWENSQKTSIKRCKRTKIGMNEIFFKIQKLWQNRWKVDGIRVEHLSRVQYVAAHWKSQTLLLKVDETSENSTGRIPFMSMQMPNSFPCMQKDLEKLVNYWSWFWEKVVLCQWRQSTRNLGQYCWMDVGRIHRKRMSNFPRCESIVQSSTQKQKMWKIVDTLCNLFGNGRKNWTTCCDRTIKFLTCPKRDQNRGSFDLWISSEWNSFCYINMENELNDFHNKINWVNFVCKRFLSVVENGQYIIMTKDTADLT